MEKIAPKIIYQAYTQSMIKKAHNRNKKYWQNCISLHWKIRILFDWKKNVFGPKRNIHIYVIGGLKDYIVR